MTESGNNRATDYDMEAVATGWHGPAVAFGLAFPYIRQGEAIVDIGVGTGLGSALFAKAGLVVTGMDISREMLDACEQKGFSKNWSAMT